LKSKTIITMVNTCVLYGGVCYKWESFRPVCNVCRSYGLEWSLWSVSTGMCDVLEDRYLFIVILFFWNNL